MWLSISWIRENRFFGRRISTGRLYQEKTGADMILWDGACIVHDEFKAKGLRDLKAVHPDAMVLVHPESPKGVVDQADVVGSTSQLINAAKESACDRFIVATDQGIFYKMRQAAPGKTFMAAPTAGHGAECKSCANCPWMAMNELDALAKYCASNIGRSWYLRIFRVGHSFPWNVCFPSMLDEQSGVLSTEITRR